MANSANVKLRSGNLRFLVKLQEKVQTGTSTTGAPVYAWQDRPSARCSIDPASLTMIAAAKETILAGQQTAFDMKVLEMHFRPEIVPLTWRAMYGPTIFNIVAVRPTNRVDRQRLFCTVGASNG
jgi:head-tail adaptor